MRTQRVWPALAALLVLCALSSPREWPQTRRRPCSERASRLQQENVELSARSQSAVLGLYALDSQLARGQRARHVAPDPDRTGAGRSAPTAEHGARESRAARSRPPSARWPLRLQQLYEQGADDSLDVLLGASSVVEALNSLDTLDRVADADRLVIEQTRRRAEPLPGRGARPGLARADADRARRGRRAARRVGLEQARGERAAYLARLASARGLNAAAISALEQQAQAIAGTGDAGLRRVRRRRQRLDQRPHADRERDRATRCPATRRPERRSAGASSPSTRSVIPLGTRMTIPGYGEGVAADTGAVGRRARRSTSGSRRSPRRGPGAGAPSRSLFTARLCSPGRGSMSEIAESKAERSRRASACCSSTTTTCSGQVSATCSRSGECRSRARRRTATEAVRLVRELAPDVVVMDLNMPGMRGDRGDQADRGDRAAHARARADDLRPGRGRAARDPGRRVRLPAQGRVGRRADPRHRGGRGRRVARLAGDRRQGAAAGARDGRLAGGGRDDPRRALRSASSTCSS